MTAPVTDLLHQLAEELREYTAMKYAGDCKCGKCQLVPRALVERIYHALNGSGAYAQPQPDSAETTHDSRVYFMCQSCEEHNPEGAVGPRSDIGVMPDGTWLCDGCYSDCDKSAYGMVANDVDDFEFPRFENLPRPAAYAQGQNDSDVIAAIDPFTRGAFTGWVGRRGFSKITLDEAEEHFSLCMADMMDAARAAAHPAHGGDKGEAVAWKVEHRNKQTDPSWSPGGGTCVHWGDSAKADYEEHVARLRSLDFVDTITVTALYAAPQGVRDVCSTEPDSDDLPDEEAVGKEAVRLLDLWSEVKGAETFKPYHDTMALLGKPNSAGWVWAREVRHERDFDKEQARQRDLAIQCMTDAEEQALTESCRAHVAETALREVRRYCDENLGPSRSSLLNKIANTADTALALLSTEQVGK